MKVLVVEDEFYARKAMIRQIKKYDQDGLFEISEAIYYFYRINLLQILLSVL